MSKEDVVQQRLETEEPPLHIPDDTPLSEFLPPRASQAPASGQASSSQGALAEDLRSSAVVRPAGGEGEEQRMSKKARAKDAKKARIQRLQEDMEGAEVPRLCEGHHPLHELCEVPKGWHGLSQTE